MSNPEHEREINDPKMPITAHLMELRKRILIMAGTIFVLFLIAFNFSAYILEFIEAPVLKHVGHLQFDTLTDPFFTHMMAAFYSALFVGFPIVLSQMWLFVRPGLYKREKKIVWPFLVLSFPLFVGGALFLYYVVYPFGIDYLVHFDPTLVPSLRIGDYLGLTVRMMMVFGLIFELPLITLFLTRMGLVTAEFLSKGRRYAIVIIFIVAAILTPPDVFTQILLAIPLVVLYEVSVVVARLAAPRRKKS